MRGAGSLLALVSLPCTFAACGGRSLANADDPEMGGSAPVSGLGGGGGSGGSGDEAVGGSAGKGIAGNAGDAVGGNAGEAVGGNAGEVVGGNAGVPEQPAYCSLPIEQGSCMTWSNAYGFDADLGRCRFFYYSGCEGNANNFPTFEACSNTCGWADETGCPATYPVEGEPCTELGHACDYFSSCSCQPVSDTRCEPLDPECVSPCVGEGCPRILAIYYFTCTCENSMWSCGIGSQG